MNRFSHAYDQSTRCSRIQWQSWNKKTLFIYPFQDAIAADSFFDHDEALIEKGDIEAGFAESEHILEGEMKMGGQVIIIQCVIQLQSLR